MSKRNLNLDILRTLAVFLVLGHHAEPCPIEINQLLFYFTSFWQRGGWIGVNVFFVLSGFLVSSLIFREYQKTDNFAAKTFLIRRGLKIYPPFYLLLAITFFANVFIFEQSFLSNIRFYLGELLFLQNYLGGIWVHTWSLAVEEHFYLGLAFFTYYIIKRKKSGTNPFDSIPAVFIFFAVVCLILRITASYVVPFSWRWHQVGTHANIDSLLFGVFLAYFYHFKTEEFAAFVSKRRYPLVTAGILIMLVAFFYSRKEYSFIITYYPTLLYLGCGMLLSGFLFMKLKDNLVINFIGYLGQHSYSIYLWHLPVAVWLCVPLFGANSSYESWYLSTIFYYVLSVVVGIVMGRLIEYPVLKYRDKMFPSTAK
jgi:peptidoglycan/LPS O-acetylase OafA/YrhL